MPDNQLPVFRYHPDPVRTGSVVASEKTCVCCSTARGYAYADVPYTEQDVEPETICPWCIADGSAHDKLDAEFIDAAAIPDDVPEEAIDEIAYRTPGYASWQGEVWLSCCDD